MDLRARWHASGPRIRAGLVAALVLLLVAAVAGVAAEHTHPRRQTALRTVPRPPGPATVDATGCPRGADCRSVPGLPSGLSADLQRQFRGAEVVSAMRTVDASTGRTYRQSLVVRTPRGSDLRLSAVCQPAGGPVRTVVRRAARTRLDLAGNQVVVSTSLALVLPGSAGCSVSLALFSFDLARRDEPAATLLAQAESARVGPA